MQKILLIVALAASAAAQATTKKTTTFAPKCTTANPAKTCSSFDQTNIKIEKSYAASSELILMVEKQ
jgi:hypothetical protein